MSKVVVKQMPAFKKVYKKLHTRHKLQVNDAIRAIIKDPNIGKEKRGDLSGIFVYKFKIHTQEILLAYEWQPQERLLMALGVHENFYRDLKNL
ncbi:MAG: addiction module toxin RelE [Legionellales bacterium]|nr:MAG: addiction module toxin RelE [Legionellales bacterium]